MKKINKDRIIEYKTVLKSFTDEANANRLDTYAACTSFYIFMSFIPFLILLIALIPILPFSQHDLETIIMNIFPQNYANIVHYLIEELYVHSKTAISLAVVAAIWMSGRGVLGITKGLNEVLGINESRNFVVMRIWSAYYTIFLLLAIILMLVISVFGNNIIDIIEMYLKIPSFVYNILAFKNLFILLVLIALFEYFYVVLPAKKMNLKHQLPGAIIGALIWWLFTRLFSLYLSIFNSYSIYGSFAILLITGVWLYTGMYIMFMGAQYNKYRANKKGYKDEGKN